MIIKDDTNLHHDPLLECLVLYTKLYHKPYSAEALTAGLPIKESEQVELFSLKNKRGLFSRAAERAGLRSKIKKVSLRDLSPLLLPAILKLKGRRACIIEEFSSDKTQAKVILPEVGVSEQWVKISDLEREYLGYTFLIKKQYKHNDKTRQIIGGGDKHWFWDTLKMSTNIYGDVLIASLLLNFFVLASPLFTMNVYDRVVPHNAVETLWVFAIGVIIVYTLDSFLKYTRSRFLEIAAKKSDIIMSSQIFEHVLDLKMSVSPSAIGGFANNLKDFDSIRGFLTNATLATLIDLPFALLFLLVIYYIGGVLVFVPIAIILLILGYSFLIRKPLKESIESTHEASSAKHGILIESLMNMETIKTLGTSGYAQWRWEEATGEIADKSLKSRMLSSSIPTVTSLLVQLNTVFIIVAGVYLIQDRELSMGGLIGVVMIASRTISPIGQVASLMANFADTKAAYQTINNIMTLPVDRPVGQQFIQQDSFRGEVEFKNVTFSYPNEDKATLTNVSFIIKPGERVGLLGRIGSGKSTIEKLILRLYEPEEGTILIDGIDINQLDPADIRNNIGYVSQDAVLFNGTVKENIVYKAPYAEDSAILEAAKISGVDTFVNQHPRGYDMSVGERGSALSGGQRQAVTVARGFLINSPIMLLDEPTSAMDNTLENRVRKNLQKNLRGKTTILIAHKTSMLELVDRLMIIENGRIIMDGEKNEVLQKLSS